MGGLELATRHHRRGDQRRAPCQGLPRRGHRDASKYVPVAASLCGA